MPADDAASVERLCRIASTWRASGRSILRSFQDAAPDLRDEARLRALIADYLRDQPELIEAWQWYSEDKRASSGPYMLAMKKVGYFDGERTEDVRQYHDPARAGADFVCREAISVLEGRRPVPPKIGW